MIPISKRVAKYAAISTLAANLMFPKACLVPAAQAIRHEYTDWKQAYASHASASRKIDAAVQSKKAAEATARAATSELERIVADRKEKEKIIATQYQDITRMRSQMESLSHEKSALNQEYAGLNARYTQLESKMQQDLFVKDREIATLSAEGKSLLEQTRQRESITDQYRKDMDALRSQYSELQTKLTTQIQAQTQALLEARKEAARPVAAPQPMVSIATPQGPRIIPPQELPQTIQQERKGPIAAHVQSPTASKPLPSGFADLDTRVFTPTRGGVAVINTQAFAAADSATAGASGIDTYTHLLRSGESIDVVRTRYCKPGVSNQQIMEHNKVTDPNRLPIGSPIQIKREWAKAGRAFSSQELALNLHIEQAYLFNTSDDRSVLEQRLGGYAEAQRILEFNKNLGIDPERLPANRNYVLLRPSAQ